MGRFSLLPDYLSTVEEWIAQICLLFAVLIFGPWLLFILYDIVLYAWRSATYELPYIGGRARGRRPPRAPIIAEQITGQSHAHVE